MDEPRPKTRTLQDAASVVFALTAVLPLLIFAYTLYSLHVIERLQAQVCLALALAVALSGFLVSRAMVTRLSRFIRAAYTTGERAEDTAAALSSLRVETRIPGIGVIQEFGEFADMFEHLTMVWRAEAEPHVGRRVLVSVRNSPQPIEGILVQVTDEGVLVDQGGAHIAVSYRRMSAIEVERS
jgi:hypothetical protein